MIALAHLSQLLQTQSTTTSSIRTKRIAVSKSRVNNFFKAKGGADSNRIFNEETNSSYGNLFHSEIVGR
ncbi:18807_t:CDS:2 [Entrophospora sp. SA101]|nr:18807_t:CDS:2 [Entrophospora sp. SA101]